MEKLPAVGAFRENAPPVHTPGPGDEMAAQIREQMTGMVPMKR
jgi:hypothetical protein